MSFDYKWAEDELSKWISEKRLAHSVRVMETAEKLAGIWGADVEKAKIAGLLHDCGKLKDIKKILELCSYYEIELSKYDLLCLKVVHAQLGAKLAERIYKITDKDVIGAIKKHTLGDANMSQLDKVIFVADYIEPGHEGRTYDKIRHIAYDDIDIAVQRAYDEVIKFNIDKNEYLHPMTIIGRNSIITNIRKRG